MAATWMLSFVVAACGDAGEDRRRPMQFDYAPSGASVCDSPMPAGRDKHGAWRVVEGGLSFLVKAPENYDPTRSHPLLVVYAPAGASATDTERYTRLTAPATRRGFVVAYVDHRPVSPRSVKALAAVSGGVARKWCIDAQRIYFAGHSDGGTVSAALALMHETRGTARAIAVSAAGMRPSDAKEFGCPQPLPVMLMHGSRDTHFPGWGAEMAAWWAQCNRCTGERGTADADGCAAYSGCATSAPVVYCEVPTKHAQWPGLQERLTEFLLSDGGNRSEGRK